MHVPLTPLHCLQFFLTKKLCTTDDGRTLKNVLVFKTVVTFSLLYMYSRQKKYYRRLNCYYSFSYTDTVSVELHTLIIQVKKEVEPSTPIKLEFALHWLLACHVLFTARAKLHVSLRFFWHYCYAVLTLFLNYFNTIFILFLQYFHTVFILFCAIFMLFYTILLYAISRLF